MFPVVTAVSDDKFVLVSREFQGGSHLLIAQVPVAVGVIKVTTSILEEDANRLSVLLNRF